MSFVKKTWKARQSDFINRRLLSPTGNLNEFDVSRAEGTIYDEGDGFTADNMNGMESRIETGFLEGGINVYIHNVNNLNGAGTNGSFKATSTMTVNTFLINEVSYSVRQGEETEIELIEDVYYSFILDEVAKTINFIRGGAGLSITVISQTEKPSSPKENTILVKSDLALNDKSYHIGYEYPTSPTTGDLFLKISADKSTYLYVDKKQMVQISLISCEYWNGTAWIGLDFETYADGSWHGGVFSGAYILLDGTLYYEDWVDNSDLNSTAIFDGTNFLLRYVNGIAYATFPEVNLTNKTSASFKCYGNNEHYIRISEKGADVKTNIVKQAGGNGGSYSVDVSALTGVYQVSILVVAYSGQAGNTSTFYEIALGE